MTFDGDPLEITAHEPDNVIKHPSCMEPCRTFEQVEGGI